MIKYASGQSSYICCSRHLLFDRLNYFRSALHVPETNRTLRQPGAHLELEKLNCKADFNSEGRRPTVCSFRTRIFFLGLDNIGFSWRLSTRSLGRQYVAVGGGGPASQGLHWAGNSLVRGHDIYFKNFHRRLAASQISRPAGLRHTLALFSGWH